jgi:hypothetical protein
MPALRTLLLFALTLLAALPAGAATIAGVTITRNSGNTADLVDDTGNEISAALSTASVLSSGANAFDTRYAAVVSADRQGGGSAGGTTTQSFNGDFTITFTITETASVAWSFTIDVLRTGAQSTFSDGSGTASVDLGALTGTRSGAGSLSSGTLSLAALSTLSSASSADAPFNQTASAVISGVGTGSAQGVSLNYVFSASSSAIDPAGAPPDGDEAALRMGLDSSLGGFSADDYPGVGLRNLATDGIFVMLRLIEAPEPDSALLLGLGLAVLAARRRRV